jgi:HAD superfamily hydrolase (TIGR01509 family)
MKVSPKKYIAVLWDIDGCLIDSEPLHDAAVFVALKDMGLGGTGESLAMLGATWDQTWKIMGGTPEQLPEFERRVAAHYLDHVHTLKPRSNALDSYNAFHELGVLQATVSNSRRNIVDANLRHLGIINTVKATISLDECVLGKPAPEPYLNAAKCLGVDIRSCIAIEDSPRGAQSAKAAGALTLFWPQDPELITEHCDIKLHALNDFAWFEYFALKGLKP